MGLSDIFKKKPSEPPVSENEPGVTEIAEFKKKRELILKEFIEKTSVQSIKLTIGLGEPALTDSKFGGNPYFPKNLDYPHNKEGTPLRLLAQLNFEQLPRLENFPQKGILQFFISEEDYGLDFDNPPEKQDNFRVIYHENIVAKDEIANDFPEFTDDFPLTGEFTLTAEYSPCPMTCSDFRFDDKFKEIYKKYINTEKDIPDEIFEDIYEKFYIEGHRISGYPIFTQEDPRGYEEDYSQHTITLFQMDSDMIDGGNEIIWGDCGVANFFISPDSLARLDFSDVLYNWDCC